MLPYAAYLRVYEPVEVLAGAAGPDPGGRDRPEGHELTRAEQERSRRAAIRSLAVGLVRDSGTPFRLSRDGRSFVAPSDETLRSWLSLARLVESLSPSAARALAPAPLVEDADDALRAWRRDHPGAAAHVREATWRLPLAWLLVPAPDEQEAYAVDGVATVRYLTPMVQARRRVARAHAAARQHFDGSDEVAEVVDLGRWLEAFHAHSWVELDLAGLGGVVRDIDVDEPDRSLRDMTEAVQALREGRLDDSAETYQRVTAWWGLVALREHAN